MSISDETAGLDHSGVPHIVGMRILAARSKSSRSMETRKTSPKHNKRLPTFLGHRRVGALKLVRFKHMHGLNFHSQFLRRCLRLSQFILISTRTATVKNGHTRRLWEVLSLRSCSRLALKSGSMLVNPVTLPPGRARPATRPSPTRSPAPPTTIGIVLVACLAAIAACVPWTTIMSTPRLTSSAAKGA